MSYLFWQEFIADYSEQALSILRKANRLREEERVCLQLGTLGRKPATEEQINRREIDLRLTFPESLKDFWRASDGMSILGFDAEPSEIFAVKDVGYLRDVDPMGMQIMSDDHPEVPDAEYRDRKTYTSLRKQDVPYAVSLTPSVDSGMYLLNPRVATGPAEWEVAAHFFGGGEKRFASFREMMLDEQKRWLGNLSSSLKARNR
jgi:hypothetical protein